MMCLMIFLAIRHIPAWKHAWDIKNQKLYYDISNKVIHIHLKSKTTHIQLKQTQNWVSPKLCYPRTTVSSPSSLPDFLTWPLLTRYWFFLQQQALAMLTLCMSVKQIRYLDAPSTCRQLRTTTELLNGLRPKQIMQNTLCLCRLKETCRIISPHWTKALSFHFSRFRFKTYRQRAWADHKPGPWWHLALAVGQMKVINGSYKNRPLAAPGQWKAQ
jgi:hypothetical protein